MHASSLAVFARMEMKGILTPKLPKRTKVEFTEEKTNRLLSLTKKETKQNTKKKNSSSEVDQQREDRRKVTITLTNLKYTSEVYQVNGNV